MWWHFDASTIVLGRLCSAVAYILMGKHSANYKPNTILGDYVVITNAKKLLLTGKKMTNKKIYTHSGFPGGLKCTYPKDVIEKSPAKIISKAVKLMLSRGPIRQYRMKKMKIFDFEHPYTDDRCLKVSAENCFIKRFI